MFKLLTFVCCFLFIVSFALKNVDAQDQIKEGKWEFTTQIQMDGMPKMPQMPEGVQLPPGINMQSSSMNMTHTQCLDNRTIVPDLNKDGQDCKMAKIEQKGNSVTWIVDCKLSDGGQMTGNGSATYNGNTMESTMITNSNIEGNTIKMVHKTTGKYLGICK